MSLSNSKLRETAIPYSGQIMGYNRNEQSDQDITKADTLGDLSKLANAYGGGSGSGGITDVPQKDNLIRILRPRFGKIVEAYLTVVIITATAETNPSFKLSAGTAFSSGITPATPTQAQIDAAHLKIMGNSNSISNTAGLPLSVEKVNITKLIPQVGDANYSEDCFVVGVHFPAQPSAGSGYRLVQFMVDLSALVTRN